MTRSEAARKLLALGPLTLREFVEITGWSYWTCVHVLADLRASCQVRELRRGNQYGSSLYEVPA